MTDFQIDRAVQNGMIPRHYMVEDATKRLSGYVKLDPITRKSGDEELIYVLDFLKMLWNGDIF